MAAFVIFGIFAGVFYLAAKAPDNQGPADDTTEYWGL